MKMSELTSEVHVPVLDNPITHDEIDQAMSTMKKGGYDHKINMFQIMYSVLMPLLPLLMNILFYIAYPTTLAISLLSALPKKGNLRLPMNYRGIQMLKAITALYDKILENRLNLWVCVHKVQSAYQKGISTIHQVFTIRLLIALAKKTNTTLYIGPFDLEKAFDKVSRYHLLKKLVKKGIGMYMLEALKRLYSYTYCVLSYGKQFSQVFRTFSGIRQGAASSATLFIDFIDDLVDYLESRCQPEPLLGKLHCLLHADDTILVSTSRALFIQKCNHMLDFFEENKLSMNIKKSGFLIINGKDGDIKTDLKLQNGILKYTSIVTYLGVKISDTGNIMHDIELYVNEKRKNVSIKFTSFCKKNFLAPLETKIKVLNTCVSAALTYGCEAWGRCNLRSIETIYRQGLKTALSIRPSVNNEIVYMETGQVPLSVRIAKQQLAFWLKIQEKLHDEEYYITKLVKQAVDLKIDFIIYYKSLQERFGDAESCEKQLKDEIISELKLKTEAAFAEDCDSKLGSYYQVNPSFDIPNFDGKFEFQRICITRYRTGSHNLLIEKGRKNPHIPREERLCDCQIGVQTLKHCILECPLLNESRNKYGIINMKDGVMCDDFLLDMERNLKLKC